MSTSLMFFHITTIWYWHECLRVSWKVWTPVTTHGVNFWSGTGLPEIFIANVMYGAYGPTELCHPSDLLRSAHTLFHSQINPVKTKALDKKTLPLSMFKAYPAFSATSHRGDWHGGTAASADLLPAQKLPKSSIATCYLHNNNNSKKIIIYVYMLYPTTCQIKASMYHTCYTCYGRCCF